MPNHGHGSTTPQVTAETTPGAYKLSALNIWGSLSLADQLHAESSRSRPAEPVVFTYAEL